MNKVFMLLMLLSFGPVVFSAETEDDLVPRKILGLYNPKIYPDVYFTPHQLLAHMPLNHLGLFLEFLRMDAPPPSLDEMKEVRAVLLWFQKGETLLNQDQWCSWLSKQIEQQKKIVLFGENGFFVQGTKNMAPACGQMFLKLGLQFENEVADNPFYFEVVKKDPSMVEFEHTLSLAEDLTYSTFTVLDPQAKIYLKMRRRDVKDMESALVVALKNGGFVHSTYAVYENEGLKKIHWRINPFRFFDEAFKTQSLPRPDSSTLNGKRIFYSHIDGDGIFNISHIDQESFSGEVIYNQILTRYDKVPITASVITGYMDQPQFQSDRTARLYKNIFSLPNIEPASHGYAHPLVWKIGKPALTLPGYRFDREKEIVGSTHMMDQMLATSGLSKKARLFLWTGDCLPQAIDIALSCHDGFLNLNGGDSRFDRRFDSYAFVAPLGIKKNGWLQVFASSPNENLYTNLWKGPYFGYSDVIETFKNTERPFRVKPINVYYHYYSGEWAASLNAVKKAYDHALSQDIFAIHASRYAQWVNDFFDLKIYKKSDGFKVKNKGWLRTLRFDEESRFLDLDRSRGVLGFKREGKRLYVSLDDSSEHQIYLTGAHPSRPYLSESSFDIFNFISDEKEIRFQKKGWYHSQAVFGGMIPNTFYDVQLPNKKFRVKSDANGFLSLAFDSAENAGAATWVMIEARQS